MKKQEAPILCRVRQYRLEAGLSQAQLAEMTGVKRQAIYDMESGRYLPNTAVALKLARHLGRRVEELFSEGPEAGDQALILPEGEPGACSRVSLAKVRGRLIGYPLEGEASFCHELRAADGVVNPLGGGVRVFSSPHLEGSVFLMGCDPAFALLAAHVSRKEPKARVACRFASSKAALDALAAGQAHMGGTHLRSGPGEEDANVEAARSRLTATGGLVVGFSVMEEGFMVAPGNPLGIRCVADLASPGVRFVNREAGAALRALLDDELARSGVLASEVAGYGHIARSHSEGAQMAACNAVDAALGLRPVAHAFGLDFVPLAEVRCDLAIPGDLLEHPTIKIVLDVLQTRSLREEIGLLRGYHPGQTGNAIARF